MWNTNADFPSKDSERLYLTHNIFFHIYHENILIFQCAFLYYTLKEASLLFLHISESEPEMNSPRQVVLLCVKSFQFCAASSFPYFLSY